MAEASFDLILEILRHIQTDIADLKADNPEIKIWLGSLERQVANLQVQFAEMSNRMDRRDEQMERVLRRLDLADAAH